MLARYGVTIWVERVIIAAAIMVGSVIAAYVVRAFLRIYARRIATRTKSELDDLIIAALCRPLFYLILVGGFEMEIRYLSYAYSFLGTEPFRILHGIKFAIGSILFGWLVIRLGAVIVRWYGNRVAARTESRAADEFAPIIDRTVKIVVMILVFMTILSHFNIDIKGLVAVLGVSSLAVALAAQETLANMIAGFILMMDRPFRVGDRIVLASGREVDVYEIGLRSSKFMTYENSLVIVPNAELSKMTINNLSYPAPRVRLRIDISAEYGCDIEKVRRLLVEAVRNHPLILKDPAPFSHLIGFGESSLNFSVFGYVATFQDQWQTGNDIRVAIYDAFAREHITIPYPQRVIHIERESDSANK